MCRTATFLERLVPWPALRTWLVGRHLKHCPRCLHEAEDWSPALRQAFVSQFPRAVAEPRLWPELGRRIDEWEASGRRRKPSGEPRPARRRLIWAGAAALAVVAAGAVILRTGRVESGLERRTAARAGLNYARLGGEQARAHIFQTPRLTFIMLTKFGQAEEKDHDKS